MLKKLTVTLQMLKIKKSKHQNYMREGCKLDPLKITFFACDSPPYNKKMLEIIGQNDLQKDL